MVLPALTAATVKCPSRLATQGQGGQAEEVTSTLRGGELAERLPRREVAVLNHFCADTAPYIPPTHTPPPPLPPSLTQHLLRRRRGMGWVIGGRVSKLHLLPTGRLDCPMAVQLILAVEFTTRLADRPGNSLLGVFHST